MRVLVRLSPDGSGGLLTLQQLADVLDGLSFLFEIADQSTRLKWFTIRPHSLRFTYRQPRPSEAYWLVDETLEDRLERWLEPRSSAEPSSHPDRFVLWKPATWSFWLPSRWRETERERLRVAYRSRPYTFGVSVPSASSAYEYRPAPSGLLVVVERISQNSPIEILLLIGGVAGALGTTAIAAQRVVAFIRECIAARKDVVGIRHLHAETRLIGAQTRKAEAEADAAEVMARRIIDEYNLQGSDVDVRRLGNAGKALAVADEIRELEAE